MIATASRFGFPRMSEVVPQTEVGEAQIDHFTITEDSHKLQMMRAMFDGDRYGYTPPGTYARLRVNGELMMTDTDMERATNSRFIRKAHGRVLIAGLGLGMIVHPIVAKDDVTEVVVIEKYKGVIDAVAGTMPDAKPVIIYHADIDSWLPTTERFDTIYFDIWPNRSTDNIEQINRLHRRFRKFLTSKETGWMGSWYHDELKAERDRDRRQSNRFRW